MMKPFRFLALFCALAFAREAQAEQSLAELRQSLGINADKTQVSISGLSSGGWLAVQYHIAYSFQIMGAGIVAAGPYHCAGSKSGFLFFDPCFSLTIAGHDLCQAIEVCSRTLALATPLGAYNGPPDFQDSLDDTQSEAKKAYIDPLFGLAGDRVWIFSGKKDELEPPPVVAALHDYYAALFALPAVNTPAANLAFVDNIDAAHAMIVKAPGSPYGCAHAGMPYIDNCNYSAAAALLTFIYPRLASHSASGAAPAVMTFDQSAFFSKTDPSVSMSAKAHLYVPKACRGGAACPLHVALHGCAQNEDQVRSAMGAPVFFFEKAGYNAWAETHHVIILYPQAQPWGDAANLADADKNPQGCWDWWGYSGANYVRKSAPQMKAIHAMVQCLTGEAACP
jgi:hypothetical protein